MLSPREENLRKVIEKLEDDWELSEILYFKCRDVLRHTDLCQITERDVRRIIGAFLLTWGGMGRVLGRDIYANWERELCNVIKKNCKLLNQFRDKKLAKTDLGSLKFLRNDIEKCYEIIRKQIAPTSTSKVLHLISPDFFPMWDDAIRKKIVGGRVRSKDYYEFINQIRQFIQKYDTTLNELSANYRKSVVKLVDEYLHEKSHSGK